VVRACAEPKTTLRTQRQKPLYADKTPKQPDTRSSDRKEFVAMAMSQDHKDALARGRRESKAIKDYLEVLDSKRPGRKVTKESLQSRLNGIDDRIASEENPLKRVDLVQTKLDAERALREMGQQQDASGLEDGFVKYAATYSERKGISYSAWRAAGVPAAVLKKAGIARTRG
jgi:hypothetical protein